MAQFVAQIRQGKPTGKIFSNKLSEMEFTTAQRESIADARRFHKEQAIAAKKDLDKIVLAKDTITIGHRTNHDGNKGRIGYVKKSAFLGKDGKFSQDKLNAFVAGPKIKGATA